MKILDYCPTTRGEPLNWEALERDNHDWIGPLQACAQDPWHHPEGDVWTHTRMVVEELLSLDAFWAESEERRRVLFGAALLHDIGKGPTTREQLGRIISPHHSAVGTIMARNLLWERGVDFATREAICGLIRWHMVPGHMIDRLDTTVMALRISVTSDAKMLRILAEADSRGRGGDQDQTAIDRLDMFAELMRDHNAWDGPFPFANETSRFGYFRNPGRNPYYVAYEDPRCTVTYMAGLPASGKDTWVALNRPDLPVVSRDDIRAELGLRSGEDEGRVTALQKKRMKEYLRKKQDFVYNTTAISKELRQPTLQILDNYNARIEIVYVETTPEKLEARNAARECPVPPDAIVKMRQKWEVPDLTEAHDVRVVLT